MSRQTQISEAQAHYRVDFVAPRRPRRQPVLPPLGGQRPSRPLSIEVSPALQEAGRNAGRTARVIAAALVVFDLAVLMICVMRAGVGANLAAAFVVVTVVSLVFTGAYRQRISPTVGEELPLLAARLAVPALFLGAITAYQNAAHELLRGAVIGVALLVVGRVAVYTLIRWARRNGRLLEPTIIVGAGRQGVLMAETLKAHPEYGLVPVGFMDGFEDELEPPIIGDVDRLEELLDGEWVRRIIIAFGATREAELVSILRAAERHHVEVHVLPRFFELGVSPSGGDTDVIWGIPLVRVRRAALRTAAWRTKRALDLVLASVLLVLASPIMACAALAVKLSSPGPILFRQARIGQRGREVEILKFRSLPVNDDSDRTWSVDTDERVNRVGRFLRRTSIDELPQLINVLRGDMSMVGPRPERPAFVDAFGQEVPNYADRHRVPVGLTGWAQVHRLRGDTSIEERARFDNFYIEHWSLWRDILVIVRTLPAMFQHAPRRDGHRSVRRRYHRS